MTLRFKRRTRYGTTEWTANATTADGHITLRLHQLAGWWMVNQDRFTRDSFGSYWLSEIVHQACSKQAAIAAAEAYCAEPEAARDVA